MDYTYDAVIKTTRSVLTSNDPTFFSLLYKHAMTKRVGILLAFDMLLQKLKDANYSVTEPILDLPLPPTQKAGPHPEATPHLKDKAKVVLNVLRAPGAELLVNLCGIPVSVQCSGAWEDLSGDGPALMIVFPDLPIPRINLTTVTSVLQDTSHNTVASGSDTGKTIVETVNSRLTDPASSNLKSLFVSSILVRGYSTFKYKDNRYNDIGLRVVKNKYVGIDLDWLSGGASKVLEYLNNFAEYTFLLIKELHNRLEQVQTPKLLFPKTDNFAKYISTINYLCKAADIPVTLPVPSDDDAASITEFKDRVTNIGSRLVYVSGYSGRWFYLITKSNLKIYVEEPRYDVAKDFFLIPKVHMSNTTGVSPNAVLENFVENTLPAILSLPKLTKNAVAAAMNPGEEDVNAKKK